VDSALSLANGLRAAFAFAALFAVLGAQGLFAQSGRANIGGTVTDSQGAVVTGATVTATNTATGVSTPATTNGSGVYSIVQIGPGVYNVKVEKEGFGAQQKENLTLLAEQNLGVAFTLQPGKVSEKVTVEATGQLVHTESAELGQTINERAITELPLNGRNPASLVFLTPGTLFMGNATQNDVFDGGTQTYTTHPGDTIASTNGGRTGSTYYMLDGAYNLDNYYLAAAPFPNPDAVQEFTVLNNNFDPRYGFAAGGVVSIVTKSGTDDWHGNAFDYYRNGGFNAKDYFTHATNKIHRNQFGGSLGGPIVKDKLFAFGNYQGTRQSLGVTTGTGFIPTAAMMNGDFSAYCGDGSGASQFDAQGLCLDRNPNDPTQVTHQIYVANIQGYRDAGVPLSVMQGHPATAQGTGGLYYPFNKIDPATFSPGAVALLNAFDAGLTPVNQYGSILGTSYSNINNYNEETGRVDYNLNDKNRISGRVFLNYFNQPPVGGVNAVQSDRSWINHWQSYAGTWTWTISPHIVNSFTGTYSRMYDSSNSGLKYASNGGKGLCYSEIIAVHDPTTTPCSIELLQVNGGYQSTGAPPYNLQNFNGINRWTGGFSDNINISKGKHLIVAGVDFLKQFWYENTDWTALSLVWAGGGNNGAFTGHGFSDFLLGDLNGFQQGGGESNIIHATMIAPYVADQIKVKPNLTVSLGLRYEPWMGPVASSGRMAYYIPGRQSTRYPLAPPGMIFPGDSGVPSAGVPSDYHRYFDPRVGLAWQPKALPNTSLRAAFGMYASPMEYGSFNHVSDFAPFSNQYAETANTSDGLGGTYPIIPFDHPWSTYTPTGGVDPFPGAFSNPGASPGPTATFTLPINLGPVFPLKYTTGRTYTWNASMEHQFGANWVARAAYVGSESDHQPYSQNINLGKPICGPVNTSVPVGTPGYCAQVTTNDPMIADFAPGLYEALSNSTANYQAGQFTLEKRFAHGLQFTANYTYAHTIDEVKPGLGLNGTGSGANDPGCLRCNRGNSDMDVPHTFVVSFVYEVPSMAGWNHATKLALGGWEIGGIYSARSGLPFRVDCGCTSSWQLAGHDWAEFAPGVTRIHTHPGNLHWAPGGLLGYLNLSDFDPNGPPQGRTGNTGRNPPGVFGPGVNTWDLNLSKNFRFTERYNFQFRWEMYNAFNRTTFAFGNQSASSSASSFGLINSTDNVYPSRVMQAAAKFTF
jgi:hypothetical protein